MKSEENKLNIKQWLANCNNVKKYSELILFFNEKFKNPYKIHNDKDTDENIPENNNVTNDNNMNNEILNNNENTINENTINIITGNLFENEDHLNSNYVNPKLQLGRRTKLWPKEYEPFNIEYFFVKYLNEVQSFPMLHMGITIFEIIINSLIKRRDLCKKRIDLGKKEKEKRKAEQETENKKLEKKKTVIEKPKIEKAKIPKRNKNNDEDIVIVEDSSDLQDDYLIIEDEHKCMYCKKIGELVKCKTCSNYTHLFCAKLKEMGDNWICPECAINKGRTRRTIKNAYNKGII